jgi:hypothetical protein
LDFWEFLRTGELLAPPRQGGGGAVVNYKKFNRNYYSTQQARNEILRLFSEGHTIGEALAVVGYARRTYETWRQNDKGFLAAIENARSALKGVGVENRAHVGRFEDFCPKYLGHPLYWHQLQWVDLLEGREPRDLHPSQTYENHGSTHILINTPPEHAKSTTLTVDYVTYSICRDPNVRVRIVSKTQSMAKEFLYAIQQRLTHPKYLRLQTDFAPGEGGFRGQSAVWKQDQLYLGAEVRDSGQKDPTLHALGIGGQIYGARADLIIVDDAVVLSNVSDYEKQIRWIQQEVLTRLGPTQRLLVVGTRVDSVDLYRELRNGARYPSGESPWTYLAQPAVLEFADDPEDWVTLWPRAQVPWDGSRDTHDEDGLFPRWSGKYLFQRRGLLDPKTWAMAYQQADVSEHNVFSSEAVRRSVNGMRKMGVPMRPHQTNVRPQGMEGLHLIGSLDPAMTGDGAFIVLGFDRVDARRYVLEARVRTAPTPAWITDTIHELTEKWGIHEWVVEKNGYQASITKDLDLLAWFAARGVALHPHFTGSNKTDPDWGVASMAGLFENSLIELPSSSNAEAIKQLIEQLITWRPNRPGDVYRGKTDLVMALWFAELRARALVRSQDARRAHIPNRYLSRGARFGQYVVPAGWGSETT